MLCEQCRMREASIVIREVVNGTVTERNLCSECASQSDLGGILMDSSSPFAKLLSGILGISDSRRSIMEIPETILPRAEPKGYLELFEATVSVKKVLEKG